MSKSNFDQKEQKVDQQQNAGSIYNVSQLEKDPFEQEEIIHNATGAARILIMLGIIGMIGGGLAFLGGLLMDGTDLAILIPIGFGAVFIGMVCYGIGYSMARSQAYRRRVQSRRK
jgi:hypothetical protein